MDTAFNPTMDAIRVKRKNRRQKLAGSLKNKIPTNTVPTAPIPVHTAYAVPMGKVCVAFIKSNMLMVRDTKNARYQNTTAFPVTSFAFARQAAKATSNKPAMIKMIQFNFISF